MASAADLLRARNALILSLTPFSRRMRVARPRGIRSGLPLARLPNIPCGRSSTGRGLLGHASRCRRPGSPLSVDTADLAPSLSRAERVRKSPVPGGEELAISEPARWDEPRAVSGKRYVAARWSGSASLKCARSVCRAYCWLMCPAYCRGEPGGLLAGDQDTGDVAIAKPHRNCCRKVHRAAAVPWQVRKAVPCDLIALKAQWRTVMEAAEISLCPPHKC